MAPRTVQRFTPPTAPPAWSPTAPSLGTPHSAPTSSVALLAGGAALGWSLLVAPAAAQAAPGADPPTEPGAAPGSPPGSVTSWEGTVPTPSPFWAATAPGGIRGPDTAPPEELTGPGQTSGLPAATQTEPVRAPVLDAVAGRIVQGTITVRAGETLWSLTGDLLGPTATEAQIAEQWPRLWQANADQIRDPDRVLPGTVLGLPPTLLPEP